MFSSKYKVGYSVNLNDTNGKIVSRGHKIISFVKKPRGETFVRITGHDTLVPIALLTPFKF